MENSERNYKKSHHSGSHRTHHSSEHHHHHHSGKYKYKYDDSSSAMERRGENVIYKNVKKERIKLMVKRIIFSIVLVSLIILTICLIIDSSKSEYGDSSFFNKGPSVQEINNMKNKIVNYEFYIEELEERLSKYEKVESKLDEYKTGM